MNIDAVHVHDLGGASYSALVAAKRKGCKIGLDLHENRPDLMTMHADHGDLSVFPMAAARLGFWPRYEKACLELADHVVVTVEEMKERIVNLGVPSDKVYVVMNVEDLEYFISLPIHSEIIQKYQDYFVLSYVGKLTRERGVQTVIKAAGLLRDKIPNLRFLIIGDGPYEDRLRAICEDLDLAETIVYTGWVDLEVVRSYMLVTDVGVLPQIINQQTNAASAHKIFQYMALGKPIITTATQSYKRINQEKEFALFAPYNDPESLTKAVMRLYEDVALRSRLGENGRQLTREKYNWRLMARDLVNIYSTV